MGASNIRDSELLPVYDTRTWTAKGRRSHAPQCSQHDEFCYLCLFSPKEETEDGEDHYATLVDTIDDLVEEQKEVPHIVKIVRHIYDVNIRPNITYVDVESDIEIKSPPWSLDSIQRHIVNSRQWPTMQFSICESILTGLIDRQQRLVDAKTDDIDEDKRKALVDTIKTFCFVKKTNRELNRPTAGKYSTRKGTSL